jgi:hypothetical protein
MECKKCNINIPTEFEFVLSQNVCPKCGNKLMNDGAMKVYIDLKKKLGEVEFVMDKAIVCERIAMFMINNYEVLPLNPTADQYNKVPTATEKLTHSQTAVDIFKAKIASLDEIDTDDITNEEIRAEEAARAEEMAIAREMGVSMGMDDDEEMVSGLIDSNKVQRLKKLALTGQVGLIKRSGT